MSSFNCPVPLTPGHGIGCLDGTTCICEDGWTGYGDFVAGSPACHLNIIAVQTLWGIAATCHLISIPFCIYFIVRMIRKHGNIFDVSIKLGILGLITNISISCLGILRCTNFRRTIGTDPASTIFLALAASSLWIYLPLISNTFLQFLVRSLKTKSPEERERLARLDKIFRIVYPISIFACQIAAIVPLFQLIDPKSSSMYSLAATHYNLILFVMICMNGFGQQILKPILKDIRSALQFQDEPVLKQIEWKLKRFIVEIGNQAVVQVFAAALCGLWPYAQRYSSYQLALSWLGTSIFIALGLYAFLPTPIQRTSIKSSAYLTADGKPNTDQQIPNRSNNRGGIGSHPKVPKNMEGSLIMISLPQQE